MRVDDVAGTICFLWANWQPSQLRWPWHAAYTTTLVHSTLVHWYSMSKQSGKWCRTLRGDNRRARARS
jgi:hypothetical protein